MKFLVEESTKADEWLSMAKNDLKMARLGQEHRDISYELFCYHCQQAAEKSLKSLLIFKQGKYPKTHSLDELIKNIEKSNIIIPDNIKKDALSKIVYGYRLPLDYSKLSFDGSLASEILQKEFFKSPSEVTLDDHAEKGRYPRDHRPINVYAYEQSLNKVDAIIMWVEQQIQTQNKDLSP